MADKIIYVNTDVNTGTYGNPDGTRGAGVRDGTSRTKGYRTLKEAFEQFVAFLTIEYPSPAAQVSSGDNIFIRLSGTTAETTLVAVFPSSGFSFAGTMTPDRLVVEGDPDVASGAIEGLTFTTAKYRFHCESSHGIYGPVDLAWTCRRFQLFATNPLSDYGMIRLRGGDNVIDGIVFATGNVSYGGQANCVYWSYVGHTSVIVRNCVSFGIRRFLLATDLNYGSAFPLVVANNYIAIPGDSNLPTVHVVGYNKPTLYALNNVITRKTGSGSLFDLTDVTSHIYNNALDTAAPGYGNDWIASITESSAVTSPGTMANPPTGVDLTIKDENSALVNAGLAYSGSGYAAYVPQVDYLGRARGTAGRGWDIGPDSWFTEGGGGGGGGQKILGGVWI